MQCCNWCKSFVSLLKDMKQIVQRSSPSEEHKLAWDRFERIRKKYSNYVHVMSTIRAVGQIATDNFETQKSEKFMATTTKEFNNDLVDQMFPYLKGILIAMIIGRVVLLVGYQRYPRLSSISYAYYMVYRAILLTLPLDYGDYLIDLAAMQSVMDFIPFCFSFWPNTLVTILYFSYLNLFVEQFIYLKPFNLGGLLGASFWTVIIQLFLFYFF